MTHPRITVSPDLDGQGLKETALWLIPDLANCYKKKIFSDLFQSSFNDDINWKILLYPHGTRDARPDHLSIYLFCYNSSSKQHVPVTFAFSIIDGEGKELIRRAANNDFCDMPDLGFGKFCTRSHALQFVHNGFLRIKLTIQYRRPIDVIQQKIDAANYLAEFDTLINNEDADFFIDLGDGSVIGLHRNILRLKWPYFKRMMAADMLESSQGRMQVIGHSADTMKKMAQYIYTSKIPTLTHSDAMGLFKAAHQYELTKLTNQCIEMLIKQLSFENLVESLCLATQYDIAELEGAVVKMLLKQKRTNKMTKLSDLPNFRKLKSPENHDALVRFSDLCFRELV